MIKVAPIKATGPQSDRKPQPKQPTKKPKKMLDVRPPALYSLYRPQQTRPRRLGERQTMNTETTTNTTPAAWIGCLSCYNSGILRGKWITAQEAADELNGDEQPTYKGQAETITTGDYTAPRCRKCGGDEFDIFDTEHLPARMNLLEFYKNAEQLAELDNTGTLEQITVLASWLGTTDLADLIEYDDKNYCGQYDKFQDYAKQYAEETGDLAAIPEYLQTYFDYEKYARDLQYDYYYDDETGHTWGSR